MCFGLAYGDAVLTETREFGALGRSNVRAAAVTHGLAMLMAACFARP